MALDGICFEAVRPKLGIWFGDKAPIKILHYHRDFWLHRAFLQILRSTDVIYYITSVLECQGVTYVIFNDRLKLLRTEQGFTQEKAAQALGIPPRSYQRLEMDGCKTHYDTLIKIADYYGVSLDWLTGRTDVREINRG